MKPYAEARRAARFLVGLCCYAYDSIRRQLLRMLGRKPGATCVILYYHSVSDGQREAFARQLDVVATLTQPISIEHVPELLPGRRYSAITFDDGFEDIIRNAVPELGKRGIPSTVFLTASYLGRKAEWWPESSAERTQQIAQAGEWQGLGGDMVTIGSHTLTHPHLPSLPEKEAKRELSDSRAILQALLNRDVKAFSFPYGDFSAELVEWCRDAGYERVFTSMPYNAFADREEFVSGRVSAEPIDGPLEFRLKLLGAYRWLPYATSCKRRLLSRSPR